MSIHKLWYSKGYDLCAPISEGRCGLRTCRFLDILLRGRRNFFVNHHHLGNLRRCALPHSGFFFA